MSPKISMSGGPTKRSPRQAPGKQNCAAIRKRVPLTTAQASPRLQREWQCRSIPKRSRRWQGNTMLAVVADLFSKRAGWAWTEHEDTSIVVRERSCALRILCARWPRRWKCRIARAILMPAGFNAFACGQRIDAAAGHQALVASRARCICPRKHCACCPPALDLASSRRLVPLRRRPRLLFRT